jgi:4'-phosphopantetheinyl transferase
MKKIETQTRKEPEDTEPEWEAAPPGLALGGRAVHVWRIDLALEPRRLEALSKRLSPDEQERAARFYFQKDRDHYTAARGSLRLILARYLDVEPRDLGFSYSAYGKPSVISPGIEAGLRFNLSHSGHLALVGVAHGRDIGIDIERVREDFAGEKIAERFFSEREVACLRSVPRDRQAQAFFSCWTRKEAYIKARGEGLSMPLDKFDVAFAPGEAPALLGTRIDPGEVGRWSLHDLRIDEGFAAALAVEGHDVRLDFWSLPEEQG